MRKAEVRVGESYFISTIGYSKGRAVIISEPEPDRSRGSRCYKVKVDYPDASDTYNESSTKGVYVPVTNIQRLWTDDDEVVFKKMRQRKENQKGWEEELSLVGYDGVVTIGYKDIIYLLFKGRSAELVLEKLTGHPFPEESSESNG